MIEFFNPAIGRWFVRVDGAVKYRYRHRLEQRLGRPLGSDEHVHHINGDRTDDRLENLRIVTNAEHAAVHFAERDEAWRARKHYDWSFEHAACIECGTVERPHVGCGLCSRCYFRDRQRRAHGHQPRQYGRTFTECTCEHCGTGFLREAWRKSRFCSRRCVAKARWARQKATA